MDAGAIISLSFGIAALICYCIWMSCCMVILSACCSLFTYGGVAVAGGFSLVPFIGSLFSIIRQSDCNSCCLPAHENSGHDSYPSMARRLRDPERGVGVDSSSEDEPCCPITLVRVTKLKKPVLLSVDDVIYEKEFIVRWLAGNRTSPHNRVRIPDNEKIENYLRAMSRADIKAYIARKKGTGDGVPGVAPEQPSQEERESPLRFKP